MVKYIHINPSDNVAVALEDLAKGTYVSVDGYQVTASEAIACGHKIALAEICQGQPVVKYGTTIAAAREDIPAGSWVHTHNAVTELSENAQYAYKHKVYDLPRMEAKTFQGYRRKGGRAGIRNEIWVIPTVGCVNGIARQLVEQNQELVNGTIDGLYHFGHPFGCSQLGDDLAQTKKLLAALARHPNAGAVLVLGLGCENLQMDMFKEELREYDPDRVKFLLCQDVDDELSVGTQLLQDLAEYAGLFKREEIPASELVVGMKCGGSTVLTEVPEMFGAENMLFARCENKHVFDKAVQMVNNFKNYFTNHGQVVYENPSPGNKKGGITTLEDKSCGCVQKGGSAQIVDVLSYAETVTKKGLNLLSGPGNDLVSATDLTAAGAHLILFTTGRGTPFGAPAPTVKISSNTALYNRKRDWIDFNAGTVAEGLETLDEAGDRLLEYVLRVAGGEKTLAEKHGCREISIFKDGVVL